MTFETGVDRDRDPLAGMAIVAAFLIWRVQDIPDQGRTIAAMRIMAGPAVAWFGREIRVFLQYRRHRMAPQAKRFRFLGQKIGIGGLMRPMAGSTLSLGVRSMGILEFSWQFGVAGKTDFPGGGLEHPGLVGGMRIMTAQALSLLNRFMDKPLVLLLCLLSVTGIAQNFYLFLQQTLEPGDMGAVAGKTFPGGCGLMVHLLLKGPAIMAGETINSRDRKSLGCQHENQRHDQVNYMSQRTRQQHYWALPLWHGVQLSGAKGPWLTG